MAERAPLRPFRERGLALVTAMLLVALVATIAAFLSLGQQLWLRQTENLRDRAQTQMVNRGALGMAATLLANDARQIASDNLTEGWARPLPPLPVEGGTIEARISDAQARFNLNNLWRNGAPSSTDIGVFRRLLRALDLEPELTEALLDWIDPDAVARPQGAEDSDYRNAAVPYRAANQALQSVDELRLVRGFSVEAVERLRPFVGALPDATPINLNTAPREVLAALFGDPALAQAILDAREQQPFANPPQLPPGVAAPQAAYGARSNFFLVALDTRIGRLQDRSEALIRRADGGTATVLWQRPQPLILSRE
jgi:general secretion pathway protein K